MLKYDSYDIVLQEIPNEISLCFTITGCQLACDGCHSEHLWNPQNGTDLTPDLFHSLLVKYQKVITCILFMGGEWHDQKLLELISIAKQQELKVALYTGLNEKQIRRKYFELLQNLDFIKTGKWIPSLGGLNKFNTNQELKNLKSGEILNKYFIR
ncbi:MULTISPECIES: anaerobic ribonucleoside-triphosphate reductase activating protein [Chryseobacterium]|uniref:Anaerobic ribonucleoside-triphosphate reductase activating protein n=3 Tax=Chryseobacterium TaxID=59732 RepID=A0AAX2IKM7_9FLAO|nr:MULTISPECIES: anaerobic ribonucleoside-triphosphate reductase activating protein [Chryseobacterium]AYM99137.1 anaerobic ribonucleoside-triphosphate reductase activating protein [Chryseobacterium sp. 3008163]AZA60124.1 anaerobic ribonucleoside-triphosphate reductase activating protein [Chryseobacterium indoltheticum]AZB29642.1 anaerobic ribonucleoside-triphosphate reductase activating protein [Chryseobacterium balustinum]MCD0477890.1 anaerobic ribonucleoside-triphosphate reductase activating 